MIFNIKTTTLIILQCEKTLYSKIKVFNQFVSKFTTYLHNPKDIQQQITKYIFKVPKKLKILRLTKNQIH